MKHVNDLEEFLSLHSIMGRCDWAPEKKEIGGYPTVKYTDWSELFRPNGFSFILSLAQKSRSGVFYFYGLDRYMTAKYFSQFRRFPIIEFDTKDSAEDIRKALHSPPVETALAYWTEFTIFSKSRDWYVYSTHDIELSKIVSYVGLPDWPHDDPYFIPEEQAMKNIRFLFPPKALANT